jgi:hypothetical protein
MPPLPFCLSRTPGVLLTRIDLIQHPVRVSAVASGSTLNRVQGVRGVALMSAIEGM